jgi:hypothetical protein
MKVSNARWRERATVLLGAYLFVAPWVFGTSEDKVSSANAWIAGACLVMAALRAPMMSGLLTTGLTKIALGAWLLASPFVLGFAGSGAAWSAWIAGALIVALAGTLSLAFDFLSWLHVQELRYQARNIALGKLVRYGGPEHPIGPGQLCWHIVECSYQIRQTLLERTSEVEVGMCVLGYRACVHDSITLNRLIDKELPESGLLRRLRLKIARRQVARSLALAREVLPPGALHAWHRSRP